MPTAIIGDMSDSPEQPTETTQPVPAQTATAAPPPPPPAPPAPPAYVAPQQPYRQSRLNQVAAWVGIVAGAVFVVAVIFGTGFMVGTHAGDRGFDRHHAVMFKQRAEPAFPRGPMGQFERGPFIFRGPNFQPPQPPQAPGEPTTPAPSRP
jgi:hypothetical protein